eukprot:Hpha_TRINITY_DN17394_c0_g1::TRINITY_DN17394_c0_g1_i1::g.137971::m.137971
MGASSVMFFYALFISACGTAGSALHGFEKPAMHSMYSGCGGGLAMLLCSYLAKDGQGKKTKAAGVNVGLLLLTVFLVVFLIQTHKNIGVPEKADRLFLFILMALGSAIALWRTIVSKSSDTQHQE